MLARVRNKILDTDVNKKVTAADKTAEVVILVLDASF